MKPTAISLSLSLALLSASSALAASTTLIKNFCNEDIFLTLNNGQPYTVHSGQAFTSNIVGQGNTAAVTKKPDFFSPETAKTILGTSTDQGVLYWSLSSQDGDPFVGEHFNVTSGGQDATGATIPNLCQNATSYDGMVHACQDSGSVILTLFACPFNAAA